MAPDITTENDGQMMKTMTGTIPIIIEITTIPTGAILHPEGIHNVGEIIIDKSKGSITEVTHKETQIHTRRWTTGTVPLDPSEKIHSPTLDLSSTIKIFSQMICLTLARLKLSLRTLRTYLAQNIIRVDHLQDEMGVVAIRVTDKGGPVHGVIMVVRNRAIIRTVGNMVYPSICLLSTKVWFLYLRESFNNLCFTLV